MNTFLTLIKREYWEHKTGLQWTPLIIGGIAVFGAILSVFVLSHSNVRLGSMGEHSLSDLFALFDASVSAEQKAIIVQMANYSGTFSFALVLSIVGFFYCLGALYDDRKDKSILFWKSLPISDAQTVLSKVVTIMILAPLIFWGILVTTNFIVMILATIFAWISGASAWDSVWAPSNFIGVSFDQLFALFMATLWAAPVIGYLLLVSSWTKKVPFLVATVPLVLLVIAESIISNTAHIAGYIGERMLGIWGAIATPAISIAGGVEEAFGFEENRFILDIAPAGFAEQLMDVDLWAGFIMAAVFIAGAIYIRRYRDEAL